jgi:hypothetical protein
VVIAAALGQDELGRQDQRRNGTVQEAAATEDLLAGVISR